MNLLPMNTRRRSLTQAALRAAAPVAGPVAGLATALILIGCSSTLPDWNDPIQPSLAMTASSDEARTLLDQSIEAHGGNLRLERDLSVAYEGEWGRAIRRIQPILVDYDHRHRSEERLLLNGPRASITQVHQGPEGQKTVVRTGGLDADDPGTTSVFYGNREETDEDVVKASALVADAYVMFILGPSYFDRPGADLRMTTPKREGGRLYERIAARLRPGLGESEEDLVVLWIDSDSKLLHRIHFTLEGTPQTRGADVDLTFHDHREFDGYLVPTYYVERVRAPVRVFAHRWNLLGFELNRDLEAGDLAGPELSGNAAMPAERWAR